MLDLLYDGLLGLLNTPFDFGVRFSLFYIAGTILIAFVIWHHRKEDTSFLAWLLPKSVYRHKSNILDIKLFIVNRLLSTTGLFGALVFGPFVAFWTAGLLNGDVLPINAQVAVTWQTALFVTFLLLVSKDFCKYWSHRIMHEWKVLWPFHSVHHSAEVLTPLTVVRSHPMDLIFRNLVTNLVVGVIQGIVLFSFVGEVGLITIGGANIFVFFVNFLTANFRHSHIWISFGPVVEHILVSPAQHQIHHSTAVEHHDKNYGSLFAIWDWAFGTLYIPRRREELTLGLSDADGTLIAQPHETLRKALFSPFVASLRSIRLRRSEPPPRQDERWEENSRTK
ncbi:MAG: sterol desaturase family protein [Boseongicola sp.]